jgi:hypothetical protein
LVKIVLTLQKFTVESMAMDAIGTQGIDQLQSFKSDNGNGIGQNIEQKKDATIGADTNIGEGAKVEERSAEEAKPKGLLSKLGSGVHRLLDSFTNSVGKWSPASAKAINSVRTKIIELHEKHPRISTAIGVIAGAALVGAGAALLINTPAGAAVLSGLILPIAIGLVDTARQKAKEAALDVAQNMAEDLKKNLDSDIAKELVAESKKALDGKISEAVDSIANATKKVLEDAKTNIDGSKGETKPADTAPADGEAKVDTPPADVPKEEAVNTPPTGGEVEQEAQK